MPLDTSPNYASMDPLKSLLLAVHSIQKKLDDPGDPSLFSEQLLGLKTTFETRVQSMTWEAWLPQHHSLLQSLRVEMYKQLRLLITDVMFLKTARQVETREQRLRQMGDRLQALAGYCEAAIQLAEAEEETIEPS